MFHKRWLDMMSTTGVGQLRVVQSVPGALGSVLFGETLRSCTQGCLKRLQPHNNTYGLDSQEVKTGRSFAPHPS